MVLNSTLCSPTADIKYKNWPGYFVYIPWPKSNSMLAPLILSPWLGLGSILTRI